VLVLPEPDGWRLPRWPLFDAPPERGVGFPVAIRAWVRERLGLDTVVLHWRNVAAPGRTDAAARQSLYALETLDASATPPAGGRWVGRDDLASLPLAEAHHRPVVDAWLAESAGERVPPGRQPWQRRGWFADAARWVEEQLRRRGTPTVSRPAQWSTKGGCCLLHARTAAGGVYFKALPTMYAREPVVTRRLAELWPDRTAEVLAVDAGRHWLLTAECAGAWLPDVADPGAWAAALRGLAEVQIGCVGLVDELRALGCPDLGLARLPRRLDDLLADPVAPPVGNGAAPAPWARVDLTGAELREVRALAPRLFAALDRLAACGVPETLEHGDFHPGQVVVTDRGPAYIDWSDAVVSHPFFSLARFMTNVFGPGRARPHPLAEIPAAQARLRDAYLEPWTAVAPRRRLREAAELAMLLGALEHALNAHQLDVNRRGIPWERSGAPAAFLRLLLAPTERVHS
jgi:hypothetical protein